MTQNKVLNWVVIINKASHAGSLALCALGVWSLKVSTLLEPFCEYRPPGVHSLGVRSPLENLRKIEFEWFQCHLPCTLDRVSIVAVAKCFGHLSMSTFKCTAGPLARVFPQDIPWAARHSLVVMYQLTSMGGMHDNDIHSSFTRPFSQRARTTDGIPLPLLWTHGQPTSWTLGLSLWLPPSQLVLQLSLETVLLWYHT